MDYDNLTKEELKQIGRLECICEGAPRQFIERLINATDLIELSKMSDATIKATLSKEFNTIFNK